MGAGGDDRSAGRAAPGRSASGHRDASRRSRRSKASSSTATRTPMVRWERRISWASPPPCNAWRRPWTTPCAASARSCCRDFRPSTTWWRSRTATVAAWPSTRPAPRFPSAPWATSAGTPTSAARRWWSAWAARRCSPRACFPAKNCARCRCWITASTCCACRTIAASPRPSREILRFAEKRLEELNRRERRPCPASSLVVGLQCGGSDAFSGVTCNPAVGYAADLLVRAGRDGACSPKSPKSATPCIC